MLFTGEASFVLKVLNLFGGSTVQLPVVLYKNITVTFPPCLHSAWCGIYVPVAALSSFSAPLMEASESRGRTAPGCYRS